MDPSWTPALRTASTDFQWVHPSVPPGTSHPGIPGMSTVTGRRLYPVMSPVWIQTIQYRGRNPGLILRAPESKNGPWPRRPRCPRFA